MASTKILFLLFISPIFSPATEAQDGNPLYHYCSSNQTFSANNAFQSDRTTLLSSLASANIEFFNFTVASGGDTVYGLFMCRGDVNLQLCHQCVVNATQRLTVMHKGPDDPTRMRDPSGAHGPLSIQGSRRKSQRARHNTRMKELQAEQKRTNEFIDEARDRFNKLEGMMEALMTRMDIMSQRWDTNTKEETGDPTKTNTQTVPYVHTVGKQIKVDFPRFDGSDALNWIFKAEQYFKYYEMTDAQKLVIASVHMEGEVLPWFQMLERTGRVPTWYTLVKAVEAQYGPSEFNCARSQLFKLVQRGPLDEYNEKFIALANRTEEIPESALLDCYLGGLKPELKKEVLVQRPLTVLKAMSIARLFAEASEQSVVTKTRSNAYYGGGGYLSKGMGTHSNTSTGSLTNLSGGGKTNLPPLLPTPNRPPIKKITPAEMQIRREKGLCYTCDEKFSPTHKCANKQLMMLHSEEDSEDVTEEHDEVPVESTFHHLSLHALRGTQGPATIRFNGSIYGTNVQILLDGGSSDNFLHPRIVQHLQLPVEQTTEVRVLGGIGPIKRTNQVVVDVPVKICDYTLKMTMLVLPVAGVDMVIGADWLETLGPHVADYSTSTVKFLTNGQWITLRGFRGKPMAQATFHHLVRIQQTDSMAECFMVEAVDPQFIEIPEDLPSDLALVLKSYSSVFQKPRGLPPSRDHEHRIELLPGTQPVKVRPYRYPVSQKTEIEQIVEDLLNEGLIRPSSSPFSAPVILVKKKDGTWRFCIDYRALNAVTVKDAFPMPTVDELIDELHGSVFYSKLDLRSGYHQILMRESDREKTAFRTHQGLYEWMVMPFGLTNAPATFQSLMNSIFRPYLRRFVLIFFDDILIYSDTWELHLNHVELVLDTLARHRLFAKMCKCAFGRRRIEYLGHVISERGVEMDESKVKAIQDWPQPTNATQLKGFLGLSGYYRRFIKKYAQIASPLTKLLGKDAFDWTNEAQCAFETLKEAIIQAPVLILPDFTKPFILETDASGIGLGAVLSQDGHPIAFFSKKLSPRMQAQSVYVRELMAITEAISKFRHYLFGHYFIIRTDHASLKHLGDQVIQTPEQEAFLPKLLGYRFDIEYKPGRHNQAADALSRVSCMAITSLGSSFMDRVYEVVRSSALIQQLKDKIKNGVAVDGGYQLKQSDLYWRNHLVIPHDQPDLIKAILDEFHASVIGGHAGFLRTLHKVARLFFWPKMRQDIRIYVQQCRICQQAKSSQLHPAGLLQPLPVPERIWEDISMDFITGLPIVKGNSVILVVVDRLSKYGHFLPLPATFSSTSVAEVFVQHIVKLHGIPKSIVTDRDKTSIGMVPFKVVYGRDPPPVLRHSSLEDTPLDIHQQLIRRDEVLDTLKQNLLRAQCRMKYYADRNRSDVEYQVGDMVWVKLRPYRQHSVELRKFHKLALRYFGPFKVLERIGRVAYKLELPTHTRIHPVFHVSTLKKFYGEVVPPPFVPLPLLSVPEGPLLRPVAVLDSRVVQQRDKWVKQFLVQWDGPDEESWEDAAALESLYPSLDLEGKEAIIWYDECMLRYSNRSFFSTVETYPQLFMWNVGNMSREESFSVILPFTLNLTVQELAEAPFGAKKFNATEIHITNFGPLTSGSTSSSAKFFR
ncbi:uncharacterized protein LOC114733022 [Neltuma alba]|uniref:uncharacterized protein LOC114733022 n=1 Tax=Neltuma alba TaxID=207710 RepID=UPI0010A3438C|nr:uncharacterized protein LOC114733022 [Prosopis alba]